MINNFMKMKKMSIPISSTVLVIWFLSNKHCQILFSWNEQKHKLIMRNSSETNTCVHLELSFLVKPLPIFSLLDLYPRFLFSILLCCIVNIYQAI